MENFSSIYDFNNQETVVIKYVEQQKKENLEEEKKVLSNLFGIIPKKYVKYFNIIVIEVFATLLFALIYYIMMLDFDTYYFVPAEYSRAHFFNNKALIALFMSINFQTTTAYVDIKCKNIVSRSFVILQLVTTFMIAFFFISV